MLNYKKETAAAVAEAEALEAAVDANSKRYSCMLNLDSSPLEAAQRTQQYVLAQANTTVPHVTHGHNAAYQQTYLTSQQPYISEEEKVDGTRNVRFENHNATPEHSLKPQDDKGHPALKSYLSSPSSRNDNSNISDFTV